MLEWWMLGRPVRLSLIEVAKAFAAPSLCDSDGLLKAVGHRRIWHEAVWNEVEMNQASEAIIQMVKDRGCVKLQESQNFQWRNLPASDMMLEI
jgi:hypothetical protein